MALLNEAQSLGRPGQERLAAQAHHRLRQLGRGRAGPEWAPPEWAEEHADELQRKAVVYVNSDTNGKGFLGAEASHDLQRLVNQVASDVPDPRDQGLGGGAPAGERAGGKPSPRHGSRRRPRRPASGDDLLVGALGSGSDYSAFLQHLGLASINLGFGGEDEQGGVYHSAYDTFEHYSRFGDPTFEYGVAPIESGRPPGAARGGRGCAAVALRRLRQRGGRLCG